MIMLLAAAVATRATGAPVAAQAAQPLCDQPLRSQRAPLCGEHANDEAGRVGVTVVPVMGD